MSDKREALLGYLILLGAAVLGYVGAAWWVFVAPVLLLTALRHSEHLRLARRFESVGETRVMLMAIGLTALNSAVFAALSFVMGRAFAWFSV